MLLREILKYIIKIDMCSCGVHYVHNMYTFTYLQHFGHVYTFQSLEHFHLVKPYEDVCSSCAQVVMLNGYTFESITIAPVIIIWDLSL